MEFKLISKNNIGSVIFLLLVVALSQAKAFNFLMETALGRFFLIIFILSLSHCHKILGVVGVLFIVIMFNSNMYYEGFGNNSTSTTTTTTDDVSSNSVDASFNSVDASSNSTTTLNSDQIKQMIQQQIAAAASNKNSSSDSTTDTTSSTTVSKKPTASEGFDILGIENNIKRGKQSNSIPVNGFMRDADSVAPYEGASFLGSFSPF